MLQQGGIEVLRLYIERDQEPFVRSLFVRVIGERVGRELDVVYEAPRIGDVRHSWADISAARDLLGYAPAVALEEGLASTVEAFRSTRVGG